MRKIWLIAVIIGLDIGMVGCGFVSQNEYNKVVKERDFYKKGYDAFMEANNQSEKETGNVSDKKTDYSIESLNKSETNEDFSRYEYVFFYDLIDNFSYY